MELAVYPSSDSSSVTPSEAVLKTLIDLLSLPVALFDVNGRLWMSNRTLLNDATLYERLSIHRVRPIALHSPELGTISFSASPKHFDTIPQTPLSVQWHPLMGVGVSCQLIANVWPNVHWLIIGDNAITTPVNKHYDELELLQSVLDCIPVRLFWKDKERRYLGSNALFAKDCGVTSGEDLIGKNDFDFFTDSEAKSYREDDLEVMTTGVSKINFEECQTRSDGSLMWLQTNKVPIRNAQQEIVGVMGSYADITEQKNYQVMIERQARFDHLTGLSNRLALSEAIEQLTSGIQENHGGGLLFLDLDHFKSVNDTLGHLVGDRLLKQVAERIQEIAHSQMLVCRLGGDEFAVLVVFPIILSRQVALERLKLLAESIRQRIIEPYKVDHHQLQLGVSIGISQFFDGAALQAKTLDEADIAMYEAKQAGRNSVRVFSDNMRSNVDQSHHLQSQLAFAIERDELSFQIQPQYGANNQWVGGELLLRWHNPELGRVPPDVFIPVSEQSGSIHQIGAWVLEQAFLLIQQWMQWLPSDSIRPLAVNISPIQFDSDEFIPTIKQLLKRIPINPSLIEIELTESCVFKNADVAVGKLQELRQLGFSLAIDDFGTGYSNLRALCDLPVQKLKVDKSLIQEVGSNPKLTAITASIFTMADRLTLSAVAEGVETQKQLQQLTETGCQHFQGYFFSRPIAIEEYQKITKMPISSPIRKCL